MFGGQERKYLNSVYDFLSRLVVLSSNQGHCLLEGFRPEKQQLELAAWRGTVGRRGCPLAGVDEGYFPEALPFQQSFLGVGVKLDLDLTLLDNEEAVALVSFLEYFCTFLG